MRQCRNVFESILRYGHDEDFSPTADREFTPTDAPAGSQAKIAILAERVMKGHPLWHEEDRFDYSGLTGAIRPRE
jgi:predicted pyridoxine 5'-phosphate oxidase superfamily flavin-nucleotide-binding protein